MPREAIARTLALVGLAAWAGWLFLNRPQHEPVVLSPHERACEALYAYAGREGAPPSTLSELFDGPPPPELGPTRLEATGHTAALIFETASGELRAKCVALLDQPAA